MIDQIIEKALELIEKLDTSCKSVPVIKLRDELRELIERSKKYGLHGAVHDVEEYYRD